MPWPTNDTPPEIKRRTLAIHEAGHAVAYLALGRQVSWATVDFEEVARRGFQDGKTGGMVEGDRHSWSSSLSVAMEELTIQLAGAAAVAVEFGCDVSWGCRSIAYDVGEAVHILYGMRETYCPDAELGWLEAHAGRDWRPELNHVVASSFQVVRSHWPAVLALTSALLERGTLDEAEVLRLFESAKLPA